MANVLWKPSDERIKTTNIYRFMNFLASFVDKPESAVQTVEVEYPIYNLMRDSA